MGTGKNIIGSNLYITVAGLEKVPAKVDTGADSSAIWASDLKMSKDGTLSFQLFDAESPFYTGERIECKNYKIAVVRSSNGEERVAYRVKLPVVLNGKKMKAIFNLSDRSRQNFPVLIGRRTIKGRFLVDVAEKEIEILTNKRTHSLNKLCRENSFAFHQKYFMKKGA